MTDVTCRNLIEEGLPDLHISQNHRTGGPSLSSGHSFEGTVLHWQNFDRVVRDFIYDPQHPNRLPDNVNAVFQRPPGQRRADFEREKYLVAEEKGVEGRFNHHVMHTLQHVAEISGLTHVQVGDFRATGESRNEDTSDIPDMTIMSRDRQECRVLGECKADWTSRMIRDYNRREGGGQSPEFKHWLRQIASYLKGQKCQYGFITTYLHTAFVWYPHWTSNQTMDVLYISRLIPHNEAYRAQPPGGVRVSVRQAMWYLMLKGNDLPSEWQMTKDDSVQNKSGLRSADASGDGGDGRSGLPSQLGGSGFSTAQQPSSGGSLGTAYARGVNHAPPKPITSDQWKKLQPPVVVSQNVSGKTEEWRMELKKGGPTKSIELRNIAQRTGPEGERAIVYSDETGTYLLQVPTAFNAFLAQRQPSSGQQSSHPNVQGEKTSKTRPPPPGQPSSNPNGQGEKTSKTRPPPSGQQSSNNGVVQGKTSTLTLGQSKPVQKSPKLGKV